LPASPPLSSSSSSSSSSYNDLRSPIYSHPFTPLKSNNVIEQSPSTPYVNHKKRQSSTPIEDLNPAKITVLPMPSAQKHKAQMLVKQRPSTSSLLLQDVTNVITLPKESNNNDYSVEDVEMKRMKLLKAAEERKRNFRQGGGGEKLAERARKLEEARRKNDKLLSTPSPLKWTIGC